MSALDINSLRAKLRELQSGSGKAERDAVLWKPSAGDNIIRVVPLDSHPSNPFTELYFIYFPNRTYLSPISFGEPDPISEFGEKLRAGGGLSKEEWNETKKFIPQRRTFLPIIDRKNPDGVRFWAFGKTVYANLIEIMSDPDYGDITDIKEGRDLKIKFTPKEASDTGFAKTAVRASGKTSLLSADSAEVKKWTTNQPDLLSIYQRYSYDELKQILDTFINGPRNVPTGLPTPELKSPSAIEDSEWGDDDTEERTSTRGSSLKSGSTDVEKEFASIFDDDEN